MNVREGLRRIGLALGIVGGVSGAILGMVSASDTWESRTAAENFQRLLNRPAVIRVIEWATEAERVNPPGWNPAFTEHAIAVDDIEVKVLTWRYGEVESLQLTTGEHVGKSISQSPSNYLFAALCPVIGFTAPWGMARVLSWILTGFATKL
jgi:hypothetical protein